MRSLGVHHSQLFAPDGATPFNFAVRAMQIEFLAPARMDDMIAVETRISALRGASARMAQRILRNDAVLVTADVRVAGVSDGRAARFPPAVRQAFEAVL